MAKKLMEITKEKKSDDVMSKVVPVAAGVAIAAGVVAVGTVLSKKENREKLGKQAEKGLDVLQSITKNLKEEVPERYKAVAQQITKARKKSRELKSQI